MEPLKASVYEAQRFRESIIQKRRAWRGTFDHLPDHLPEEKRRLFE